MTPPPIIRPRARRDLAAAADYLVDEASEELAERFLKAAKTTWAELGKHPECGARCDWMSPKLGGCRKWHLIKPFDEYLVFYRTDGECVEVVRVLHGRRDTDAALDEE